MCACFTADSAVWQHRLMGCLCSSAFWDMYLDSCECNSEISPTWVKLDESSGAVGEISARFGRPFLHLTDQRKGHWTQHGHTWKQHQISVGSILPGQWRKPGRRSSRCGWSGSAASQPSHRFCNTRPRTRSGTRRYPACRRRSGQSHSAAQTPQVFIQSVTSIHLSTVTKKVCIFVFFSTTQIRYCVIDGALSTL